MNFNEMRENKFKCWDKKLNKWVDIFTHKIGVQLTDVGFAMSTGWDSEDNPTWDFSKVEFDRYEYPQFTGLLDKNGKEIYEGDIITSKLYPFQDGYKHDIYFKNGDFRVRWTMFRLSEMFEHTHTEIEVIGNLYENPELL